MSHRVAAETLKFWVVFCLSFQFLTLITMTLSHHQHQSSLEEVIDFSSLQSLELDQHNRATDIFNQIMTQYESYQTEEKNYKQITLFHVTHESAIFRDNFLSCFFLFVEKNLCQEDISELSLSQALSCYINLNSWSREQREKFHKVMTAFSDYFINNFFLSHMLNVFCVIWNTDTDLVKASVQKTSQFTSVSLSEV